MNQSAHNKIVSFIWSIADDCLRDVYVRGKYRDVILPMVVLRRIDTLLEPTKEAVLEELSFQKNEMKLTELDDDPLKQASGYVFYNTSPWTLKSLYNSASNNQQRLLANFEEYLLGFSDNVKEIITRFKLLEQIHHMSTKHVLLDVIDKFISPEINLTPFEKEAPDGTKLPALSNLGMGYVFEELIRKFNEENNEEAGEHFTPREVIELMTNLVFEPVKNQLPLVMTVYDPACGSGGMLTESQNFIQEKYPMEGRDIYLYGKEINDETYAICKSDMMIKGNNPANIKVGSTLSTDEFSYTRFDFMLSNPPYGKSWASEQKYIKNGKDIIDPRFEINLNDYWGNTVESAAIPRSSDGQLLFLMEMVNKMKGGDSLGSRIASVHNGSSLFTGDAGSGESNIRRFIIENDMLEAIVQLPNNLFYNTGITTYIWLLNNKKPTSRQGKVQLIDASLIYQKLRKNLGNKNCEFSPEHIAEIVSTYLSCETKERETDSNNDPVGIASQVFNNADFGYYKVNIERPDRRSAQFTSSAIQGLRFDNKFGELMTDLYEQYGDKVYEKSGHGENNKQSFLKSIEKSFVAYCEENEIALATKDKSKLLNVKHWLDLKETLSTAELLFSTIGDKIFNDFNEFKAKVDLVLKTQKIKLTSSAKKSILDAVSWYDENACKVVKKIQKFTSDKLQALLEKYSCGVDDLSSFGYYPSGKKDEFITYESSSDLRDSESIPLDDSKPQVILSYFLAEVAPHVDEAWVDLESVKIGYEISFNKYFYHHKPLRTLEEVANDILALEARADGLISQILGTGGNHG